MWLRKKQIANSESTETKNSAAIATPHDPFASLRFRDYRLFILGRVLLFVGSRMQVVAIGWELYDRTGSAMVLGGVGLVQFLPIVILTLIAGHLADQRDRKRTVLLTTLMLTCCSLGLVVLSFTKGPILLIYGCLLLTGIARAFNKPASDAIIWQLIPTNVFTNAATWNSSSFQMASVLGPSLGGLAIALQGGATGVYVLAAIASLLCFVCVAMIKAPKTLYPAVPPSLTALI